MTRKGWFRYYLLVIGSTVLTLGIILAARTLAERRPFPGVFLGALLIGYGILRLRQRKQYPQ